MKYTAPSRPSTAPDRAPIAPYTSPAIRVPTMKGAQLFGVNASAIAAIETAVITTVATARR